MENLEKMPQKILTLHVACSGFENLVWRDILVCNSLSMHHLAQVILNSLDIEDLSNYTIVSAGEKFTECKRKGVLTSDSQKFTMADLYMDKGEQFLVEVAGYEFAAIIVDATDSQFIDPSDYPKVLAMSQGSLADAQKLIDLEFPHQC